MHSSHHRPWLASLALGATLLAQGSQNPSTALTATPAPRPATLLTDQPGTGTFWVLGATYKAAFGADGFTFIPFLGAHAPRNHPVRFALRAVRVGGQELPVAASAKASLQGNRAVLDRGTVTESYDLGLEQVEQTFTIAADRAGDVELELAIATDLTAGAASADGVRFGNDLGGVQYGTAYLVRDTGKTALGMHWSGQALHLRVPAALRGAGPVVIDPLVSTFAMTQTMVPASYPDIAYDASTDHWLVTWAQAFSQTDLLVSHEIPGFREGQRFRFEWNVTNLFNNNSVLDVYKMQSHSNDGSLTFSNTLDLFRPYDYRALAASRGLRTDPRYGLPYAFQLPRTVRLGIHFLF